MSHATERTRLLSDKSKPQYAFDTSIIRERQRRVKQFQCCLCVIFISILIIGFLVTVAYTIKKTKKETNSTDTSDVLTTLLTKSWPLLDKPTNETICENETQWNEAISQGQKALNEKNEIEKIVKQISPDSPSYKHQKIFPTSPKTQHLGDIGYAREFSRRYFPGNQKICNKNESDSSLCETKKCDIHQKYRTYDGSCNNLKLQNSGVAFRPFRRALPPDYADGISKPRVGKDGTPLPSARTVSLEVHRPYYKNDDKFTVVLAVWGQFLDHDMTATALNHGLNGTTISCCNNTTIHPECFPVEIEPYDPYHLYNITCLEFLRSASAPTCCLGPREQMNQVTSFIDGSVIYSVDNETVKNLRTMTDGKLDMYINEDNRTLLPVSKDLSDGCNRKKEAENGKYCFLTGDSRANENLHLTSMHLIWARQHNYVAKKLASLNNNWNDEKIFQETRKIIGAQMQHITYNEFLPVLLGPTLMKKFDLYPKTSGYFTKYNDRVDSSIANNFATAAFRFAHSIIPGLMKFLANDSSSPEFIQLHKMLFDPFKLYQPGGLDRALRSAMDTTIQANDPYFTDELKQHLFEDNSDKKMKMYGLDLVSLNIQRGRDHGLVGYNSWREHCGLRRVSKFEQLQGDIDDDSLKNIKSVYRDVEDIDLYTGALSEKPINGSILGATVTCLILDQFIRVKYGDRFWYENPNWFTIDQLNEIRKSSLAKIFCENGDSLDRVQPLVMEKITRKNEVVSCNILQEPSFIPWKDNLPHVDIYHDSVRISIKN